MTLSRQIDYLEPLDVGIICIACGPKFVVRFIAYRPKLPYYYKFLLLLKQNRQEFNIIGLIGSLDFELKAREKDKHIKGLEGNSSANLVQNKNFRPQNNAKVKYKKVIVNPTTSFMKRKANMKGECFIYGGSCHWTKDCLECKDKKKQQILLLPTLEVSYEIYSLITFSFSFT